MLRGLRLQEDIAPGAGLLGGVGYAGYKPDSMLWIRSEKTGLLTRTEGKIHRWEDRGPDRCWDTALYSSFVHTLTSNTV